MSSNENHAEMAFEAFVSRANSGDTRDPLAAAIPCVVGPTASGKTALAIALAEALDGEVISVDSVQIYRRFDIGSAKPTAEERARVPHHLIDCVDAKTPIDAGRFAELADEAIAEVRRRNKRPILVGGTFLWLKGVVQGLAEAPRGDAQLRAELTELAEREGRAAVWEALNQVDPATANRLHPNDLLRTSRALEVFRLGGVPLSELHAAHGFRAARYPHVFVAPARTAADLEARIAARAATAIADGWIDETRALLADGYRETRAMGAVGYREVRAFLDGELAEAELLPTIIRATRVFVRRQRTWLRDEAITCLPLPS